MQTSPGSWRLRMSFVCLLLLCHSYLALGGDSLSRQVAHHVRAATVMVSIQYGEPFENNTSWGTGFIIADGLVMTNAHVVSDKIPKRIILHGEMLPPTEATVLMARYDTNEFLSNSAVEYITTTLIANAGINRISLSTARTNYDMAILAFTPPSGSRLPSLVFNRDSAPGQAVFAIGYPGSDLPALIAPGYGGALTPPDTPLSITAGRINHQIDNAPQLLMHDALCKTGNSGGPLVNSRGEVVGMQTWSAAPDHRNVVTSFAIGARDLAAFALQAGYRLNAVGHGSSAPAPRVRGDERDFVLTYAKEGDANFIALAGLLSYLGECGFSRDEAASVRLLTQAIETDPVNPHASLYRAGLAAILVRSPHLRSSYNPADLLREANKPGPSSPRGLYPDLRLVAFEAGLLMQGGAVGVPPDSRRSFMLAQMSLDGGFSLGFALAGYHHYFGDASGAKNHDEALALAREAARSGVPEGISLLAHLYYDSQVVKRSAETVTVAGNLAAQAAQMGDPWALGLLANMYYDSVNPQEKAQARHLAERAALQGNRMAVYCLGRIAWDVFRANPVDVAQAAKAWAFIDAAERKGVRIHLPGAAGAGDSLRSANGILSLFPPDVQQWLVSQGRREQAAIAV